jgi:O-methyltransferase
MAKEQIKKVANYLGVNITRYDKMQDHYQGLYTKYRQFTMVPQSHFINNLQLCSRFGNIEGDIVECGVWKGGVSAAMAELFNGKKTIHLFDSFQGLPEAKKIDGPAAIQWQREVDSPMYHDNCTAEEAFVIEAFKQAGIENYKIYKGWFQDTLDRFDGSKISILRLDADWYDSTIVCFEKLFPLVSTGGLIILDDYYTWDGCAKAVHDYLSKNQSISRISQMNNEFAYIIKKD